MTELNWSDELKIGLTRVDEQHKTLFAMANRLLQALSDEQGEASLKELFDELKAYTEVHFKEEEAYMAELGYPHLEAHSAEHALLLVRVNTLWRMIQSGEELSPIGVALFIKDWITGHIMEQDIQIGQFAAPKA